MIFYIQYEYSEINNEYSAIAANTRVDRFIVIKNLFIFILLNKIKKLYAGEYFVAGELARRGFTAAVPMSNTKDFDILAINRESYKQFAIQVKTTRYKKSMVSWSKK